MLVVVSPAKTLDYETAPKTDRFSLPELLQYSEKLIEACQKLTPAELAKLMKISDKLAGLNAARFAQWQPHFTPENAKQAVFAFKGDVYTGLAAETLNEAGLEFAQHHLRILSGLYGVLRPLDLMMPYRLEMGTKLENDSGKNLYAFWGDIISNELNKALTEQGDQIIVNLASNEYFKAVQLKSLQAQVITPVFKDYKNGQYKIISFYAKKARGLMARYVIDNKLTEVAQLKAFSSEGYYFSPEQSTASELVFLRDG